MVVLRAIGNFFKRIGRWIRDTAWVQPLLIVGGIFAIIFSIPYITNWVKSWFKNDTVAYEKYYSKVQLSIENCDEEKSEADDLFKYLLSIEDGTASDAQKKKYGEKFFLAFVQKGCSGCEANYDGFNYLQSKYTVKDSSSAFYLEDGKSFKIHSIYMDETDDGITYDGNIFEHYIYDRYAQIFEGAAGYATNEIDYQYLINQGGTSSSYYSNAQSMAEKIESPTVFLVDANSSDAYGISEVLFAYSGQKGGSTALDKALTLVDCWNHKGIFAEGYQG